MHGDKLRFDNDLRVQLVKWAGRQRWPTGARWKNKNDLRGLLVLQRVVEPSEHIRPREAGDKRLAWSGAQDPSVHLPPLWPLTGPLGGCCLQVRGCNPAHPTQFSNSPSLLKPFQMSPRGLWGTVLITTWLVIIAVNYGNKCLLTCVD